MKIAVIARGCQPGAGIERYTFELVKRLSTHHQVDVITFPNRFQPCGAKLLPVNVAELPIWWSVWAFSRQAGQLARQGRYDLVHTQGSDGTWGDVVTIHSSHYAGMRASLKRSSSCINKIRKQVSLTHRSVLLREKQVCQSARKIITVSERVKHQLQACYRQIESQSIETIYPGCGAPATDQAGVDRQRRQIRATYRLTDNQFLLALVANDPKLKGAALVIRALAMVQAKPVHVLIVSSCRQPELERLTKELKLDQVVHFAQMPGDAMPAYYAADASIGLPEYESFGLAYLEAMTLSKPVIVSRQAGIAELIKQHGGGLLVPFLANPAQIAQVIDKLYNDNQLYQQLSLQAKKLVNHYQWDSMVEKIEKVYEQLHRIKRGSIANHEA